MRLQEIQNSHFAIDFFLTMSCNKTCEYCTSYTIEQRNLTVDMDFLEMVLDYLKNYKIRNSLLGGEPGLVKNLKDVFDAIKRYDNFVPSVLSNSFVRKRYPEILEDPNVIYMEHLIEDFHSDKISKLGNYQCFEENKLNNYNVVIKTPNYFKYYDTHKNEIEHLSHKNTQWKTYNSRSKNFDVVEQSPVIDRKLCSKFPQVPVIDFENKNLRHCSKRTLDSKTFDITEENIHNMMRLNLFQYEDYCHNCCEKISNFPLIKYMEIL